MRRESAGPSRVCCFARAGGTDARLVPDPLPPPPPPRARAAQFTRKLESPSHIQLFELCRGFECPVGCTWSPPGGPLFFLPQGLNLTEIQGLRGKQRCIAAVHVAPDQQANPLIPALPLLFPQWVLHNVTHGWEPAGSVNVRCIKPASALVDLNRRPGHNMSPDWKPAIGKSIVVTVKQLLG